MTKTAVKKAAKPAPKAKHAKKHPPVRVAPTKAAAAKKAAAKVKPAAKPVAVKPGKPVAKAQLVGKAKPEPKVVKAAAVPVVAKKGQVQPLPVAKANGKVLPGKKPGESETPGDADSPLLDMSDVGVRKMIARAKQRGYVTYDELNAALPGDQVNRLLILRIAQQERSALVDRV